MPKIRCHYLDCLFLDERYCSAAAVEINPEAGCLTYKPNEETELAGWDDVELDDWDEMESDDETEDIWASDEDDADAEEDDVDEY